MEPLARPEIPGRPGGNQIQTGFAFPIGAISSGRRRPGVEQMVAHEVSVLCILPAIWGTRPHPNTQVSGFEGRHRMAALLAPEATSLHCVAPGCVGIARTHIEWGAALMDGWCGSWRRNSSPVGRRREVGCTQTQRRVRSADADRSIEPLQHR